VPYAKKSVEQMFEILIKIKNSDLNFTF